MPHQARRASVAVVFLSVVASAGCLDGEVDIGSNEAEPAARVPEPEPEGEDSTVCEAFCSAAAEVDCPRDGDCLQICADLERQSPNCIPELHGLLACATPLPQPERCGVDYGEGECQGLGSKYETCRWLDEGSIDREHGGACWEDGLGMTFENGRTYASDPVQCHAMVPLSAEVVCEEGQCECMLNGKVVATCTNLIQEAVFASVYSGCCASFYADFFAKMGFD
jgi:hypothetical protein